MPAKKATPTKSRALSAVYSEQRDNGAKLQKTFLIPHNSIKCDWGENIRPMNEEHVVQWINSIEQGDYVPPVLVEMRGDDPYIIEGFHRWEAYNRIEGDTPIVLCAEWKGDEGDKKITMRNSAGGLPLSFVEDADVIADIKKAKCLSPEETAQKLGISRTAVNNKLLIAEATKGVRKLIIDGKVSATTAIDFIIKHGQKDALAQLKHHLEKLEKKGKTKVTKGNTSKPAFPAAKLRGTIELLSVGLGDEQIEQFFSNFDPDAEGDTELVLTLPVGEAKELMEYVEDYLDYNDK